MKRFFLLVLIVVVTVIIYNCDDAGITTKEDETQEIAGTVNNWSQGTKILKAVVKDSTNTSVFLADSTTIATDGAFTLKLKTPPDNFYWVYSVIAGTNCNGSITINPSGLKQASLSFNVFDESNNQIGTLQKKSYDIIISDGSHSVSYLNFKEAGTVTGSMTCYGITDTNKVNANFNPTVGWNTAVLLWNQFRPQTHYYEVTIQNTEPPGSLWFFVP